MSSSESFRVKPGYAVLHFVLPCGAQVSKQVLPAEKERFLNDTEYRAIVIAKATEHVRQQKEKKSQEKEREEREREERERVEREREEKELEEREREEREREEREREERERAESEREEKEREERERVEREWGEREEAWAEKERQWAERDRRWADCVVNEPSVIDKTTTEIYIGDSDSSDGPSPTRSGAAARVMISGGEIRVANKQAMKKAAKRKKESRPTVLVKKRITATNRTENGEEILKNDDVQVPKASTSTDDKDLGRNKRFWTEEETEHLLDIYEAMMDDFNTANKPKRHLWKKVAQHMKNVGYNERSDIDCSVKWKNLKRHYLDLCDPKKDPSVAQERLLWPYMESMDRILKTNPTVTLEHVTEVVDSVKTKGTSHVQAKGPKDDYKNRLLVAEEKRAEALALIAQSQIGKNEAINKLALAIQASYASR